jgi:hypothetical protein
VGENSPWKINAIKGDLKTLKTHNANLVCAINVFNEMYGDISRSRENSLSLNAEKASRLLAGYGAASSAFLVVEPGFPRCGEFISLLRGVFLEQGILVLSPCPHNNTCAMLKNRESNIVKGKKRWCYFAFETDDAPEALHRLSSAAGLPKERAVLSFLYVSRTEQSASGSEEKTRIISDAFPLPHNRFGRYCCSAKGLALLAGDKTSVEKNACGSLASAFLKDGRDPKSGAIIFSSSR